VTVVTTEVARLLAVKPSVLVAIDGYGGAGKTTLANRLQSEFSGSSITLDDFAQDVGSGADRSRFLSEVLIPLSKGQPACYRKFDWKARTLADAVTIDPIGLILIEGVSVNAEDFTHYYDLRIWIDCTLEEASRRMRERDKQLHHPTYFKVWEKEDADYARTEPWSRADIVIRAEFG
jgi:uridine kinase